MSLRISSLGAKLLLTLYIGRYLTLADMGSFGLVTACVAIAVSVLGFRLTYVSVRDLVDASPEKIVCVIRDQTVFYAIHYLFAAIVSVTVLLGAWTDADPTLIISILLLSILESYAVATMDDLIALRRPTSANILLFVRASFWPFPAMVLGFLWPEFRNVETLLVAWIIGILASLLVTVYVWRELPWRYALSNSINWQWIRKGVAISMPIWLGAVGGSVAQYAERFVVEFSMGREFVGVISFYTSFSGAIFSIIYSSVLTFSFPHLVTYHQSNDTAALNKEFRAMTLHAVILAIVMAALIGGIVPFLGDLLKRPELTANAWTLWLLLVAICLRCASESVHYVLYARQQDRIIWMGYLLSLVPAVGLNMLLVPILGLSGVGYSAIGTSIFLGTWRLVGLWKSDRALKPGKTHGY